VNWKSRLATGRLRHGGACAVFPFLRRQDAQGCAGRVTDEAHHSVSPRHCERGEAIQGPLQHWIASLAFANDGSVRRSRAVSCWPNRLT